VKSTVTVTLRLPFRGAFHDYRIEADRHTSVLDALETVRRRREPDLVYRHSCHHGSCGSCACLINHSEHLACTTKILALKSEVVLLEPLRGMRVLSGLAFDAGAVIRDISSPWRHKRTSELGGERFEECIECGACLSACPPYNDPGGFVGPAALAALYRERLNDPASAAPLLVQADSPAWVHGCRRAVQCSRVCPAAVVPARKIQELRTEIGKKAE
jgi:succinate dehydrogenase/fumarate reductase iron-sulfur protein